MAAKLIRFGMKDRTTSMPCNSNEYDSGENRELPDLVPSVFPRESWMLPINTSSISTGAGGNSRMGGVTMTGATVSGATGALDASGLVSRMMFEIPLQLVTAGVQQVFVVNESDLATRKCDIVLNSAGKLEIYDQASSVVPVATCTSVHPVGTPCVGQFDVNMGTNGTDGVMTLTVLNAATRATIDSCTASSLNLGDFGGGSTFGDCYRGMFASRGAGSCVWNFGSNMAVTTGGFLPAGWTVQWIRPLLVTSAANGWSAVGTSDTADALFNFDTRAASLGKYLTRASGAGTGSGSRLTVSLMPCVGTMIFRTSQIYGVTVLMDGFAGTGGGSTRYKLIFTYKGVEYGWTAGGTAQMNPPVAGDGGFPHTRCLVYFDVSGSSYLGPDGLAWDAASIIASTVTVEISNDTGIHNVSSIMVGVCLAAPSEPVIGKNPYTQFGNTAARLARK